MVKTPPYQKRGKCGYFMPQFDSHGSCFSCRAKCKGLDPCAQGADVTQCAACSALSEEQWTHLRENFAKRSAYRSRTGSQGDSFEEQDVDEPVCTGEDLSRMDDTLLDLEPESSGSSAPVTGISPLTSLLASLPASSENIQNTSVSAGPVNQPYVDPSAFFKAPEPVHQTIHPDALPPGQVPHTSGGHSVADRLALLSFPQPQRTTTINVPQTPRTQMIKSHLEQQNFELTKDLQMKNQEQMRDISAQLQTGLQAFLQQSMEQMFNRMAPPQTAPPPPPASTAPHIVSITPVSALPPAAKPEEPMDSAPSHPPPEVKKGISGVKGSSAIATQSIQAVASNIQVPTSISSSQPSQPPSAATIPRLQSPLQALEQEEYGTDTSVSSFGASNRSEEPTDPGEQAVPPNLPFRELVQKVREFLSIPDPAAEEDYKLGSALGRDPLLLQQEIKLPMVIYHVSRVHKMI